MTLTKAVITRNGMSLCGGSRENVWVPSRRRGGRACSGYRIRIESSRIRTVGNRWSMRSGVIDHDDFAHGAESLPKEIRQKDRERRLRSCFSCSSYGIHFQYQTTICFVCMVSAFLLQSQKQFLDIGSFHDDLQKGRSQPLSLYRDLHGSALLHCFPCKV